MTELTPTDRAALQSAVTKLEGKTLAMNIAAKAGMPVEALLRMLPANAQGQIATAVDKALQGCLRAALALGGTASGTAKSKRAHTLTTAATGAVGGFFGLPGLVFELPVTTTVILHSIAGIARSQGENLSDPAAALACLQVLALGPEGKATEAVESAYYATRAALAQVTRDAAAFIAQKGVSKEGAPVLISFLSRIGGRFGIEVSEKAAAQLIPVAGAAGGLALNILFTDHFQRIAEGHFTVRRLERLYSPELVQREYHRLRAA